MGTDDDPRDSFIFPSSFRVAGRFLLFRKSYPLHLWETAEKQACFRQGRSFCVPPIPWYDGGYTDIREIARMQAQLKVAKGSSTGKIFSIAGSQFIIGRATGCHLRPQSDAISRQHCAFVVKDGRLYVKDLGSRNGTYLNNEKLSKAAEVKNGDAVRVGPLYLEVIIPQAPKNQADTETVGVAGVNAATTTTKSSTEEGGLIDWLLEEDASEQDHATATREFSIDTSVTTTIIRADIEEESAEDKKKKKKKKKEFGKLPAKTGDSKDTENSKEAAADTLRQLYNRGT